MEVFCAAAFRHVIAANVQTSIQGNGATSSWEWGNEKLAHHQRRNRKHFHSKHCSDITSKHGPSYWLVCASLCVLVFVLPVQNNLTLCGGVMEQQAVTAHHSAPWTSRRVMCVCACASVCSERVDSGNHTLRDSLRGCWSPGRWSNRRPAAAKRS